MTDAEMILAYDKARKTRNDALDALSKIHKQLLTRVKKAKGVLKTKSGYATVSYSTNHVKDKETVARLVADGTIPTTVKRIEKLSVVAAPEQLRADSGDVT